MTVVPRPSSSTSLMRWEQAQQLSPVVASYEDTWLESLVGAEDEDVAKFSTWTGMSSQILHGWDLLLSTIWI